jgi:hypothetical protein
MPYIDLPANTTGIQGLLNYTSTALEAQYPGVGSSIVGIAFLFPLWVIIFLALARLSPLGGFVVASFICVLITLILIPLNYVNPYAFGLFAALTAGGAIAYYMQTRV